MVDFRFRNARPATPAPTAPGGGWIADPAAATTRSRSRCRKAKQWCFAISKLECRMGWSCRILSLILFLVVEWVELGGLEVVGSRPQSKIFSYGAKGTSSCETRDDGPQAVVLSRLIPKAVAPSRNA